LKRPATLSEDSAACGSKGSGRSYAPHSAASAAWKRTVVSAARLSLLPSLTNSRFPRLGAAEADAFLVDVVAEAAATRALRDTVYAPICASNATANDAVLASAFYAKVLAQPEGTRLLTGRVRATLLAALPACRCADGACPDAGWCRVATAACRGADGKLASYVGPNATETENTDVEWWAYC
jgi:hypothetical protein